MKSFTATFAIVNQTKGAVRYGEIDDKGEIIEDYNKAHVGVLYLRKSNFNGAEPPRVLSARVSWEEPPIAAVKKAISEEVKDHDS